MVDPSQVRVKNLIHLYEKKAITKPKERADHEVRIQSKYNQLVSNLASVEDIVAEMHRVQKLTNDDIAAINQAFSRHPNAAKEELLNLIMTKPKDVYDDFLSALQITNQQSVVQMLLSEPDLSQTEAMHSGLITRQYQWLTKNLDSGGDLVMMLYQNEVLTRREREHIEAETNCSRRNEVLLSIISRKSPKEFQGFLEALTKTGQTNVVKKLNEATDEMDLQCPQSPDAVGAQARTVPKPSALPKKPPLPSRPKPAIQIDQRRQSSSEWQQQLSPANPLSPRKRSFSKLESQLSQPRSPGATEVSLKVASIRQNSIDVEEEIIQRKKSLESVQLQKEDKLKLKEVTAAKYAQKATHEEERPATFVQAKEQTETPKQVTQHKWQVEKSDVVDKDLKLEKVIYDEKPDKFEVKEYEQLRKKEDVDAQLRISVSEKEKLREELKALENKLQSTEAANEKLKNDIDRQMHDSEARLKHASRELEEQTKQLKHNENEKDELRRMRDELVKEKQLKQDENEIRNVKQLASELRKQLEETEKQLMDSNSEKDELRRERIELLREKQIRQEQEQLLKEAETKILEVNKELYMKTHEQHPELESMKEKLKMEKQEREKLENEARATISELNRRLVEKDEQPDLRTELESVKDELKMEKHGREKLDNEARTTISELNRRLREKNEQPDLKNELESVKDELKMEKHEREKLENEARTTISELNRRLREKDEQPDLRTELESVKDELKKEKHGREKLENEARATISELNRRLLEKNEQSDLRTELDNTKDELNVEKQEREKLENEARTTISELNRRLREKDEHLELYSKQKNELESVETELKYEKQLRQVQENFLDEARERINELNKQISDKDHKISYDNGDRLSELERTKEDLEEERQIRIERERVLTEAREMIVDLQRQLKERTEELQHYSEGNNELQRVLHEEQRTAEEHGIFRSKTEAYIAELEKQAKAKDREMERELETYQVRLEMEQQYKIEQQMRFSEAEDTIQKLVYKLHEAEQHLFRNDNKNDDNDNDKIRQELMTEKQIRKELEQLLSIANENRHELGRQMEEMKMQLKHGDGENVGREKVLDELTGERQMRQELEKSFHEVKEKLKVAGEQLDEKEVEIRKTKKELAKERLLRRDQEKLLTEANETLSRRLHQTENRNPPQPRNEMQAFTHDLTNDDRMTTKEPESKQDDEETNPLEFGISILPAQGLNNLHVGIDRPRRKKTHAVRSHAGALARIAPSSTPANGYSDYHDSGSEAEKSVPADHHHHPPSTLPHFGNVIQQLTNLQTGIDRPKRAQTHEMPSTAGGLVRNDKTPDGGDSDDSSDFILL